MLWLARGKNIRAWRPAQAEFVQPRRLPDGFRHIPEPGPIIQPYRDSQFALDQPSGLWRQDGASAVHDDLKVTRSGFERLFRAAFRIAEQRRKWLSLIAKANVLPSMVFFREVFDAIAPPPRHATRIHSPVLSSSACLGPKNSCRTRCSATCSSRRQISTLAMKGAGPQT